ncbi:MAG: DMT family transporter, partial [Aquisalimonadaceae bacterium]
TWVILLLVILIWGVNWPVMKVGLDYIPPLYFTVIRLLLGGLCMLLVAVVAGKFRLPTREEWPLVLGVGLIQIGAFLALVTVALQFVPAGRSAILAYTTSIWVLPVAAMTLGERLSGARLLGFGLGIGGVAVMFNPFGLDWTKPGVLLGNGLLLLAALLWALLIVFVRARRHQGPPLVLAPWQFAVAAVMLAPAAVLFEDAGRIQWSSPELLVILFYNGTLATAFCIWAMITITRSLPAVTTSIASLGVPAFGLFASAVALGERLSATNVLGLLLIAGGVIVVALTDRGKTAMP